MKRRLAAIGQTIRKAIHIWAWGTALAVAASPTLADALVVDGDTLKAQGHVYRLWGIDSPEYRQTGADGWPAGVMAFEALRNMVAGRAVACEHMTNDRYGRLVAICRTDGVDIGAAMVRAGQAWAFIRYSQDYVRQEQEARAERAGVHAHGCIPAWDWRAIRRGLGE